MDSIEIAKYVYHFIFSEPVIADYFSIRSQLDVLQSDIRDVMNHPSYCLPFLQPGRLVNVKLSDMDFGWGVIINFQKTLPKVKSSDWTVVEGPNYIVDIMLYCDPGSDPSSPKPCPSTSDIGEMMIIPCALSCMYNLSSVRIFIPVYPN